MMVIVCKERENLKKLRKIYISMKYGVKSRFLC